MQSDNVVIEVLDRQYAAKFIHVTALYIYPAPKRDALGIDAWAPSSPE
jgi:hypothetical protein